MDKDIEEMIISAFIINRKKERARYELWNEKKRDHFIWHIEDRKCFDDRFAQKINQSVSSYQVVYDILKKNGAPDECYVIGFDNSIDGKIIRLEDALKKIIYYGPVLISCIHGKLAYFEGEENGIPDRLLLKK